MPTTLNIAHANTTIFGRLTLDAVNGDIISAANRFVMGVRGSDATMFFGVDTPGAGAGISVAIDDGTPTNISQSGANYNTATTIFSGLTDGWHKVEVLIDPTSAGVGNFKLKPSSHLSVTGTAPALQYAPEFGRAYHTGNDAQDADVYRLGPRLSQSGSGVALPSMAGGYNGGGKVAFKSDASDFIVYYATLAAGPCKLTLLDVDGAIVTSGQLAAAFTSGEITLATGLAAGTVREYTLNFNVAPTSIATVGGTMSTKPDARNVFTVSGTSIMVTAGEPSWTPEDAGSLVGELLGGSSDNLAKGGSPLIATPGEDNASGEARLDEVISQNPRNLIVEHLCNDTENAATFAAALKEYFLDAFAGCNNLQRAYWAPLVTTYTGTPPKASTAAAWITAGQTAIAEANTTLGSTKIFYIDTSGWRGNVDLWDGVHPSRTGAVYAAQQLAESIRLTLDVTVPTVSSVATSTGGTRVNITFSEEMRTGYTGFTPNINGTSASIAARSWTSTTVLSLLLETGITSADTVTLDYAPGDVKDLAGNSLAAITARAVTNNSTVSGGSTEVLLCSLPFKAAQNANTSGDTFLTLRRGDILPALLWLQDTRGVNVPVTLSQLSARLVDSAGAELVADLTVAVESESLGLVTVTIDTTEAALDDVASCVLEVFKEASATNIAVFPLAVKIEG